MGLSILWPTKLKADSTVLVRFGRALHWLAAVGSGLLLSVSIFQCVWVPQAWEANGTPVGAYGLVRSFNDFTFFAAYHGLLDMSAISLAVLLIGRMLRYILAGE